MKADEFLPESAPLDLRFAEGDLRPEQLSQFKSLLTTDLRVSRTLPSDGKLLAVILVFFSTFSFIAARRYLGIRALTATQMTLYFGVISAGAFVCALAVVQEMIPGSKRRINTFLSIAASAIALVGIVLILFPNFDSSRFVENGAGCFRFGSICGVFCGLLLSLVIRRGLFTSPLRGALAASFFASLAGVAALAMHCSLLTAPHILVWHFGVLIFGLSVGAGLGTLLEYERPKRLSRNP